MSLTDILNKKVVVLWSGGLDSTCLIKIILNDYRGEVFPIFLKHGQRNEKQELTAIEHYDKIFHKEYASNYNSPFIASSDIPAKEFKDNNYKSRNFLRNSDFINNAARFAIENDIETILLATFYYDMIDGQPKFFGVKENEINIATGKRIRVISPYFDESFPCQTKIQVIDYCKKYDFNFSDTRSCYENSDSPCGKCEACKNRDGALADSKFEY